MINKAILIGRLGKDPEMRRTTDDKDVATLTLATSERWKGKDGTNQEKTEWHRLVAFDKLASIMGQYLVKGSMIYVEGKITTRKWTDSQGQEKYTTEIIVSEMKMLGDKGQGTEKLDTHQATAPARPASNDAPFDDQIPF